MPLRGRSRRGRSPSIHRKPSLPARRCPATRPTHNPTRPPRLNLTGPTGWRIEPIAQAYSLAEAGDEKVLQYKVTAPATAGTGELKALGAVSMTVIAYPHIPPQTLFPPASLKIVRDDIKLLTRKVGYV